MTRWVIEASKAQVMTQDVVITRKGIHEPQFGHKSDSGSRDIVLPGNEDFVEGDLLQKLAGAGGGGLWGPRKGKAKMTFSSH